MRSQWALGSIPTNKASGSDGTPVELFQILKDDAVKVLLFNIWKASKSGKFNSGHRTGKGQFSFQSQRKAKPKNVQTTTQLHSSHMLAKQCSKFSEPGFNRGAWWATVPWSRQKSDVTEHAQTPLLWILQF